MPVALGLAVNPGNVRARRLYDSLGFAELKIATLLRRISIERSLVVADRDEFLPFA